MVQSKLNKTRMEKEALQNMRHTLAHLLAAAVMELYPSAKRTIGPAIENGFYFDFDFGDTKITDEDLQKIEDKMRTLLPTWTDTTLHMLTKDAALAEYPENPYKHELINEFSKNGEDLSFYKNGSYWDLCKGGHSDAPSIDIKPDAFKLIKLAGAYWRGDEKNKMLTRIYGFAFESKAALDEYMTMLEEAEKRDHRKLGKELGLFTFSDLVGPGLPLWTPKGTIFRNEVDRYIWELRKARGYQKVTIPHLAKKSLYETSGHWNKYSEDLFKVAAKESDMHEGEYVLKPMNCPHHTQIFDGSPRSYREMPQRYAETTMVYRAEQSGELAGLTRVLSITQDDAHVFCRESQLDQEINAIWDIVMSLYKRFGFNNMKVRLSFRDPATPDKYIGDPKLWDSSEATIKAIAEKRRSEVEEIIEGPGEAAFYGPKLDFMAKDSIGRQHQVATIQLDRNQPERFNLYCINEKGEQERVAMIHAAIAGSLERFSAVVIEHLAGEFPFRFAPVQVQVIPVKAELHGARAQEVVDALNTADIRVECDLENKDGMGKQVRHAKSQKYPYWIIIGDKDIEAGKVTLESRDKEGSVQMTLEEVLALFSKENK